MSGGPHIAQALLDLRRRLREWRPGSELELAVRAAVEVDPEQRAWALVALASRLRDEGKPELARLAADGALALDAGSGPSRAAQTCSVALLADAGEFREAAELGEELLAGGSEARLLKALARVYWGLWRETEDDTWHERWWQVNVLRHDGV